MCVSVSVNKAIAIAIGECMFMLSCVGITKLGTSEFDQVAILAASKSYES